MTLKNLDFLKNNRNLLAFSGGTDSSALFNLLKNNDIPFDIISVNYNTRETSLEEYNYGKYLAKKNNKEFFGLSATLPKSNLEKVARDIRYKFFKETIEENKYDNLITGHNLNDKMEWFLMQMTKGCGSRELFGMDPISEKDSYKIVRPLISCSKNEIMEYLESNNIKYFFDKSNLNEKYKRNYFRHNYVESLVSEFKEGLSRTFDILEKEIKKIDLNFIIKENNYYILNATNQDTDILTNKALKIFGYVMSGSERKTFKENNEIVFTKDKKDFVCVLFNDNLYIAPYLKNVPMPKNVKESFRKNSIPNKVRPFLYFKSLV